MNKSWTVTVEEDEDGNAILPLPKDMIDELGWLTGDILNMDVNEETGVVIVTNITCDERKGKVA